MDRLKKRAEFLAVAKGVRSARRGFVLQAAVMSEGASAARVGFTVTKKAGNAVERNRIRRRLREAIRLDGDRLARAGTDYVLVGRREALGLGFAELRSDLEGAFRQVHRSRDAGPSGRDRAPRRAEAGRKPDDDASPGGTR